jgi:hypothetical protein
MNASRQSPRKVINRILSIQMEPNIQAIVQNISDEGLGFHALTPLTQSGTIRFSFADNGRRAEAIGELVWIDSLKKTGGLRFTSLTRAGRDRMRNWVDQTAAVQDTVASEPVTPRSGETGSSGLAPTRADPGPGRADAPPPATPSIQPDMPGFALLEADPQHLPYSWDQEMALQNSRPKFLKGFLTGAIITAILAAAWFLVYGNPAALLAQWRARIASSPATRSTTDTPPSTDQPPAAAVPPSPSQGLPPSRNVELPANTEALPTSAGDPPTNHAAMPAPTETPSPGSHAGSAVSSVPPRTADSGDAEFALAERYLREKSGPGSSAAAANSLWAAISKGNVSAEIALADLYARGDGVTKNCDQARVLLRAAAEKGSSMASQELAHVVRSGCR